MSGLIKIGLAAAGGYALARVIEGNRLGLSIVEVLSPDKLLKSVHDIKLLQGDAAGAAAVGVTSPSGQATPWQFSSRGINVTPIP